MASSNEYFTPERVDEQIEQLYQTGLLDEASDETRLVNALQRSYRVPLEIEDRAALARARQRLASARGAANAFGDDEPVVTLPSPGPGARPGGTPLTRILSGLAAVVLVGALIGGWFAVTRMIGTPSTAIPGEPGELYIIQNSVAYRLDGYTGKVTWQDRLSTSQPSASTYLQVVNGVVYVTLGYDVYALDARNGKQIWHVTNPASKGYFWSVVDSGRVYLYSLDFTFQRAQCRQRLHIMAQYHLHHRKWVRVWRARWQSLHAGHRQRSRQSSLYAGWRDWSGSLERAFAASFSIGRAPGGEWGRLLFGWHSLLRSKRAERPENLGAINPHRGNL